MAKGFAGNSLAAFSRTLVSIIESTTAGNFDAAYVANSISIPSGGRATSPTFTALTGVVRVRFDLKPAGSNAGDTPLTLFAGGVNVFRLYQSSTARVIRGSYWNGSAWVDCSGTYTLPSTLETYMLEVTLGVGGGFALYQAGASVLTSTSTFAGTPETSVDQVMLGACGSSSPCQWSQIMVADYDIRDSHYAVPALNGNSAANTDGTGAYTDIVPPLNDATAVKLTTSGHKRGQTKAAITVPSGYIIGGMMMSARGRASGSITDGKLGIRTAGGTNNSGTARGYNGSYEPRSRLIENDPDTATNFTQAGFNSAEIYQEAA